MKGLYIIVILLLSTACSKKVTQVSEKTSIIKSADSSRVVIVTEKSDSILIIPGSETTLEITNPCDSLGRLIPTLLAAAQGKSKATVDTRSGRLVVTSSCDSTVYRLQRELYLKDSAYKHTDSNEQHQAHTERIVTYQVPSWCWWLICILSLLCVLLGSHFVRSTIIKFQ